MLLGGLYHVESYLLDPFYNGWPVHRVRRYTILRHRYKTKAFISPWTLSSQPNGNYVLPLNQVIPICLCGTIDYHVLLYK